MNETTVITNLNTDKKRLQYQYNPVTKQIIVKSESADSVKLYNLQGICLKQITANTKTILNNLPGGIYFISSIGVQTEKIQIY